MSVSHTPFNMYTQIHRNQSFSSRAQQLLRSRSRSGPWYRSVNPLHALQTWGSCCSAPNSHLLLLQSKAEGGGLNEVSSRKAGAGQVIRSVQTGEQPLAYLRDEHCDNRKGRLITEGFPETGWSGRDAVSIKGRIVLWSAAFWAETSFSHAPLTTTQRCGSRRRPPRSSDSSPPHFSSCSFEFEHSYFNAA